MLAMTKQRKVPFFFQTAASREAAASAGDADVDDASDDDAAGESLALNLTNHFLIAMPSMLDPVFGGSVVYLCELNKNGALSVVINKPTDMTMDVLLERVSLKLEIVADAAEFRPGPINRPVMFGGPVQVERGFVLHSPGEKTFTST